MSIGNTSTQSGSIFHCHVSLTEGTVCVFLHCRMIANQRKFCFCLMLVSKCFDPGWVMTLEYMNLQLKQYHFKTTKLKKTHATKKLNHLFQLWQLVDPNHTFSPNFSLIFLFVVFWFNYQLLNQPTNLTDLLRSLHLRRICLISVTWWLLPVLPWPSRESQFQNVSTLGGMDFGVTNFFAAKEAMLTAGFFC